MPLLPAIRDASCGNHRGRWDASGPGGGRHRDRFLLEVFDMHPQTVSRVTDTTVPISARGGDETATGNVRMEISNEMVRLYKQQLGRGPTTARTMWAGADVLVVVLESTLTPAERNLVRLGEHQRLRETRMYFQYALVQEFCEPVERLTGGTVRAFVSGTDSQVDGLAGETFILWPADAQDARSRSELSALSDGGSDSAS